VAIQLVTGPPGNGKSFFAVRKIALALSAGKCVVTNVDLRPDWAELVANKGWRRFSKRARRRRVAQLHRRVHVADDLAELLNVRVAGTKEGRAVAVLDEAHNWMNSRTWSAGDRAAIVKWFTQHRKLGFDVYLIAQDAEMLDKQVRVLFEEHVRLRNLKRARFCGIPLFPVNLFLAVRYWHTGGAGHNAPILGRELFPLSWAKDLYDTMATHVLEVGEAGGNVVTLPREA